MRTMILSKKLALSIGALLPSLDILAAVPVNEGVRFNFLPIEDRRNVGVFAACGIGNLPVGMGNFGNAMCDDNGRGPGGSGVFVHDGYIPGEVLYLLEQDQQNDIYHMVLIDKPQSFKMEVYIRTGSGTAGLANGFQMSNGVPSGHMYPLENDPHKTGNGSGDPTRVQFRMLIEQDDFTLDMIKNSWNKKPVITQSVWDVGFRTTTTIDMSNSTYADMNTPATVIHKLNLDNGLSDFLFDSRDTGGSTITGGRFAIRGYANDGGPSVGNLDTTDFNSGLRNPGGGTSNPFYQYVAAEDNYGVNIEWLDYWHGSQYWQPGDSYGGGGGGGGGSGGGSGGGGGGGSGGIGRGGAN